MKTIKCLVIGLLIANTAYAGDRDTMLKALIDGMTAGVEEAHPELKDWNREQHNAQMRKLEEENLRLENQRLRMQMFTPPNFYEPNRRLKTDCLVIGNMLSCN